MSSDPLFDCADFSIVCTVSILDVLPRILVMLLYCRFALDEVTLW
jgi:hypothetical protein